MIKLTSLWVIRAAGQQKGSRRVAEGQQKGSRRVSEGSWKDYGLNISNRQVGFSVFKNAAENAMYKICKNFKPNNKNLTYLITDSRGKILKNSHDLVNLIKNTNWKKL